MQKLRQRVFYRGGSHRDYSAGEKNSINTGVMVNHARQETRDCTRPGMSLRQYQASGTWGPLVQGTGKHPDKSRRYNHHTNHRKNRLPGHGMKAGK